MLVKLRQGQIFPHLKGSKNIAEVRAVATWKRSDGSGDDSLFVDSQKDLDKLPPTCETVNVMFSDGAYVELPIKSFKELFIIIPEGEMTDAIYGTT